ncbi:MAG: carboxypeptidase-like regulatory domain-containing protein [bacterium]|nr:carboxypeptidase-like regulatory domain-containing protein [bacterium]
MKRSLIFLTLLGLFLATTSSAAIEARKYLLVFFNAPEAGTASNSKFSIPLPENLNLIEPAANISLANNALNISGPAEIPPGASWGINIILQGPSEVLDIIQDRELLYGWRDDNFSGQSQVIFETAGIVNLVARLQADPEVVEQTQKIGIPLAVGLGGVGVISLGAAAASASASLAFNVAEFFRYILFGFLRFKKRKPWGIISNATTRTPIAGSTIKIFDAQSNKLRETQVSDKEGRFGFLVPPGNYYIKASHRGFTERQIEIFKVTEGQEMTNVNIPLDSVTGGQVQSHNLWRAIRDFIENVNPYLLAIGTLLSLAIAVIVPITLNYIVLIIYIGIDILKFILSRKTVKSFGVVKDQASNTSLDLAIVRIYDLKKNWLLNTKVTDTSGKFNFLVTPGSYYLTAIRHGYQPFQSPTLDIKKSSLVSLDVKLVAEK